MAAVQDEPAVAIGGDGGPAAQALLNTPNHLALDRTGKPAEARPFWEKVLKMAEGYKDKDTVATARARLARNP